MGRRKKTGDDFSEAAALGKRLREARESHHLTQEELGAKIGGRSQRTISKYESGQTTLPLNLVSGVCQELGIRSQWLITGLEPMKPEPVPHKNIDFQLDNDLPEIMRRAGGVFTTGTAEEKRVLTNVMIGGLRAVEGLNPKKKK